MKELKETCIIYSKKLLKCAWKLCRQSCSNKKVWDILFIFCFSEEKMFLDEQYTMIENIWSSSELSFPGVHEKVSDPHCNIFYFPVAALVCIIISRNLF